MPGNKSGSAAVNATGKKASNPYQKHSAPFHISDSLFDNKRLKEVRSQWEEALKTATARNKKTENRRKECPPALKVDETIDLLSDEEDAASQQQQTETHQQNSFCGSGETLQVSKEPSITLIPAKHMHTVSPALKRKKNKHKTPPKRSAPPPPPPAPTESILLSDDDDIDNEGDAEASQHWASTLQPHTGTPQSYTSTPQPHTATLQSSTPTPQPHTATPQSSTSTPQPQLQTNNRKPSPHKRAQSPLSPSECIVLVEDDQSNEEPPQASASPSCNQPTAPILFAQVDDEVSVSLVPRSRGSGTCNRTNKEELFPMLPDETTVHTVIANRTYELSLTKLREGLATCGVPEFAETPQAPAHKKGNFAPPPPTPPPAPVSLKLSSDLSISLISDDEEDDVETMMSQLSPSLKIRTIQPPPAEEELLVPLPVQAVANGFLPKRKKRKLS